MGRGGTYEGEPEREKDDSPGRGIGGRIGPPRAHPYWRRRCGAMGGTVHVVRWMLLSMPSRWRAMDAAADR
jgi:hypothetical protein